jgi:rhamnogalacturonan endolyase
VFLVRPLSLLLLVSGVMNPARGTAEPTAPPATVTENSSSYILTNGYLTVTINKRTGDLTSLTTPATTTPNIELMGYLSGHHAGYWEQSPALAPRHETKITIQTPDLVEVSVKGFSDGQSILGKRPTAAGQEGGLVADLEIRYTLARSAHGVYTYAIFTHQPTYPAGSVGESRFGFKLSGKVFDWLSVDSQRDAQMPNGADWDAASDLNMKEARSLTTGIYKGRAEHKYDYCADQFKTPAFGWSSTTQKVGLYIINPSMEYLSSGPLHFELTGHIDDGDGGDPTLLDYWRGTHYGGSVLNFAANERWAKVVGPIFIYVPTGASPTALFTEAQHQATVEAAHWPYAWVKGVDYPQSSARATVHGRMKLVDSKAQSMKFTHLLVGLAYPDQPAPAETPLPPPAPEAATPEPDTTPDPGPQRDAQGRIINRGTYVAHRPTGARATRVPPQPTTWQNDAKHYEFWVNAASDGSFNIPNVRPGTYQLHAMTDGVLGEYASDPITVNPGQPLDLHTIEWHPVHFGRQLWQVGTPNRSAKEFRMGNDHWHWGLYLEYSKLFPNDVNFTIGKSDPARDWFIYQVPHVTGDDPTGKAPGRATPWTIHFEMPASSQPAGTATLRFGLSGVSARALEVRVNDKPAGQITDLLYNATINRDGVEGTWVEKDLTFDASLLKPGANTIVLTVPAGGPMSGICYDVIRLELAPPSPTASITIPAPPQQKYAAVVTKDAAGRNAC